MTEHDGVERSTATEELRRLLDERGVKHTDAEDGHTQYTWWSDGDHEIAACNSGERLAVYNLTPEQAIAATLGSCNCPNNCTNSERTETCHIDLVGYNQHEDRFQCRSCDWSMWFKRGTWPQFNYCPNCGRKVVSNG
jgi:hypothetical protein